MNVFLNELLMVMVMLMVIMVMKRKDMSFYFQN